MNLPPLSADVRARIPAQTFAQLGLGPPSGSNPDPLDSYCGTATAYVEAATGRTIDSTLVNAPASPPVIDWIDGFMGSPDYGSDLGLASLGFRAVILRVVQEASHEATPYTRATVSQDYLQSFRAGSYAETRRDPNIVLHSRGSVSDPMINPWKELSDILWLLCTGEMFDYWMMRLGTPMPASVLVEGDFRDTWDAPADLPAQIPGFGPPGMGGDFLWAGGIDGGGDWGQ